MILHDYFRSSAAYRVRIALNLKGLDYCQQALNLAAGEHRSEDYLRENPQGLLPALRLKDELILTQSLAIIEYLDEVHPGPVLLPASALGRARVRALAQIVACDIHPLNNLRVLRYLGETLGVDGTARLDWYRHWIATGLTSLEAMLRDDPATGNFCHGDEPGLADLCLVPQLYNARRFQCELSAYPTVVAIDARCQRLQAFQQAHPERQPDAD